MSAADHEGAAGAAAAGETAKITAALEAGLTDLRREIDALPELRVGGEGENAAPPVPVSPLQVISRQGRLILKLSASAESLDARYKELSERQRTQEARLEAAEEEARAAKRQARQTALEAVRLMDALDWVQEALTARGLHSPSTSRAHSATAWGGSRRSV
jgi:hypothetical protein